MKNKLKQTGSVCQLSHHKSHHRVQFKKCMNSFVLRCSWRIEEAVVGLDFIKNE